jgi:hypothetical protein
MRTLRDKYELLNGLCSVVDTGDCGGAVSAVRLCEDDPQVQSFVQHRYAPHKMFVVFTYSAHVFGAPHSLLDSLICMPSQAYLKTDGVPENMHFLWVPQLHAKASFLVDLKRSTIPLAFWGSNNFGTRNTMNVMTKSTKRCRNIGLFRKLWRFSKSAATYGDWSGKPEERTGFQDWLRGNERGHADIEQIRGYIARKRRGK